MPQYNSMEEYHRVHGPWKNWQCKGCKKEFTSILGEWGWSHSHCEECYKEHRKRVEKRWKKINPERWQTIVSSYRKQRRRKYPEWKLREYARWKRWAENNKERRREIARQSYHRRKSPVSERAARILISED